MRPEGSSQAPPAFQARVRAAPAAKCRGRRRVPRRGLRGVGAARGGRGGAVAGTEGAGAGPVVAVAGTEVTIEGGVDPGVLVGAAVGSPPPQAATTSPTTTIETTAISPPLFRFPLAIAPGALLLEIGSLFNIPLLWSRCAGLLPVSNTIFYRVCRQNHIPG